MLSIDANKPVISGTTGWLNDYIEVKDYCIKNNGTFLYSSSPLAWGSIYFRT